MYSAVSEQIIHRAILTRGKLKDKNRMENDQDLMGGCEMTEDELAVHDANTAATFSTIANDRSLLAYATPEQILEWQHLGEIFANLSLEQSGNQAV